MFRKKQTTIIPKFIFGPLGSYIRWITYLFLSLSMSVLSLTAQVRTTLKFEHFGVGRRKYLFFFFTFIIGAR